MKKLLSSLVIFTLIISSFSCLAFADGEKIWNLPMVDFSSSSDVTANTSVKARHMNEAFGWMGSDAYYTYDAEEENLVMAIAKNQQLYAGFNGANYPGNRFSVSEGNEKVLVIKAQFYRNEKEAIDVVVYDKTNTSYQRKTIDVVNLTNMKINGTAVDNYYGDSWVDIITVIDMPYNANATDYTVTTYANGKVYTSTATGLATYVQSGSNDVIAISIKKQTNNGTGVTRMDNTGVYTVDRNDKPALTASVNNFTVTTSNEVPLALLANGNLSKVKANGKYLPLEAIKANKGGLSFEIDEDYLTAGENIIDLSEVKDILGTSISGTTTFTMTKELKEKEVPSTIDVSYNDKKGANTVTSRFFAPITSLDFAKVVFEISTIFEETPYTWEVELDEVYENVTVNDTVYSKTGAYVATAALGDVPSDFDGDFEVNAYAVDFEGNSVPLN